MGSKLPQPPPQEGSPLWAAKRSAPPDVEQRGLCVLPVGSSVVIGQDIEALVTGICIRGLASDKVTYECSWWNGRSHECKWLDECEVKTEGEIGVVRIGFRNGSHH